FVLLWSYLTPLFYFLIPLYHLFLPKYIRNIYKVIKRSLLQNIIICYRPFCYSFFLFFSSILLCFLICLLILAIVLFILFSPHILKMIFSPFWLVHMLCMLSFRFK